MDGTTGNARSGTGPTAGVRDRIVEAALALLHESGGRRLTQTAVARRAGIRQSHLTYYFPTRDDLLAAVTAEAVGAMAAGVRAAVARDGREGGDGVTAGDAAGGSGWVRTLASAVAAQDHMRMFVGMIAEADVDPSIRAALVSATVEMESAVADAIGGDDARQRARMVLAAMWGLGLHAFVMRPEHEDVFDPFTRWLENLAGNSHETEVGR